MNVSFGETFVQEAVFSDTSAESCYSSFFFFLISLFLLTHI